VSVKIYEGYRLAEGADIWEFTERLRREGNELRNRLDLEAIEAMAGAEERKRRAEGRNVGETREARLMLGYHAWRELEEALGESRLSDPHQLSATFIRDPGSGRILARLYAGSKMEHVFTGQPGVEPFGYWDNSDREEGCTDEEWEERKAAWLRCLGPGFMDPPVRRGISFDLRGSMSDGIVEMIYGTGE
jgi:hypothetical protein